MSHYPRNLNLLERTFVRSLVSLMSRSHGEKNAHDHAVTNEYVRIMGLRGFFRYMKFVTRFIQRVEPVFGEANTQTLLGLASLMAGCGYCGYGHTLAGALLLFRDTETLHPVHPSSIEALFELKDHEIMARLDALLSAPGHEDLRRQLNRMYRIYLGELEPETEEDALLKELMDFWRWTIECTIVEGVSLSPADSTSPHPVGGDRRLRERYEAARAAERAGLRTH